MILSAAFLISSMSIAQEEELVEDTAIYIPLKPPFVVNYGGVGRLRYLKAEVTVRVQDSLAADSIRHHLPLIRNNLVLLFSKQAEEEIETQVGKEKLRVDALEKVRDILLAEDEQEGVVDLYFENFVIQR
ncbi:MAG: flagellar basal body-associated FliL family protein [Cellvibrionaceae bacterium]